MNIRPIWMDCEDRRCRPVFLSGLLLGISIGMAIASIWWWVMV